MSPSDQFRLRSCNFKVKFGNLSQTSYISTENLFNPSQRKDCKRQVLAQICRKVGLEVVKVRSIHFEFVILALARFEILDHSIHSSRNRQKVKLLSQLQQIVSVCYTRQREEVRYANKFGCFSCDKDKRCVSEKNFKFWGGESSNIRKGKQR